MPGTKRRAPTAPPPPSAKRTRTTPDGRIYRIKNHLVYIKTPTMMAMDYNNNNNNNIDPSIQTNGAALAPQACSSCRKQKRKCDKQLPSCGLCIRIGRPCDYTDDTRGNGAAPSPEEFTALRQEVAELKNLLASNGNSNGNGSNGSHSNDSSPPNFMSLSSSSRSQHQLGQHLPTGGYPAGSSTFPSLYFLDSNAFEYERFQIPQPFIRVPPGALSSLGNSQDLRQMIENYFATIHTHFPIISKIRLYQHLSNPLHEPGADLALLFLAMQLSSTIPPEGMPAQTQLYQDVKSFYTYLESQNGFSIQSIQALLLISLYEVGHAIYPAAYLTIGHAARLGQAMGLHARSGVPVMLPRPTTWTEQEERRRVWWGVIILDRFINIGHRGKPFASADPGLDTHLPTDDASWDKGVMLVAAPLSLSASQTIRAAPFARTCQASHLLGKVIRHLNDPSMDPEYKFEEAQQLNRTFRALAAVLPDEAADNRGSEEHQPTLCTSMAICYSALLTLYDNYSCTERAVPGGPEAQLLMQEVSINGLREFSETVVHLARRVRAFVEREGAGRLSPLVIDSFYQAAANYAWYVRESSDVECAGRLAELKEVLALVDGRWRVAGWEDGSKARRGDEWTVDDDYDV
ncbi:hypothetical protein LTS10_008999 [Elasticomyces elasticus]|nr:hypothetical protein LTS10_008999 [Elasticomyces elasticus]